MVNKCSTSIRLTQIAKQLPHCNLKTLTAQTVSTTWKNSMCSVHAYSMRRDDITCPLQFSVRATCRTIAPVWYPMPWLKTCIMSTCAVLNVIVILHFWHINSNKNKLAPVQLRRQCTNHHTKTWNGIELLLSLSNVTFSYTYWSYSHQYLLLNRAIIAHLVQNCMTAAYGITFSFHSNVLKPHQMKFRMRS